MSYEQVLTERMVTLACCDGGDVAAWVVWCAREIPACVEQLGIDQTTSRDDLLFYLPMPFAHVMAKAGQRDRQFNPPTLPPALEALFARVAASCREADGFTLATRLGNSAADALTADGGQDPALAVINGYLEALAGPIGDDERIAVGAMFNRARTMSQT